MASVTKWTKGRNAGKSAVNFYRGGKGQNRKAMHAPTGSIAFIAAARASWLVEADKEDAERRLFLPIKNNLTKNPGGLSFRIGSRMVAGESVGCVEWEAGKIDMSADDALSDESDRGPSQVDTCCEFLNRLLANGPKAADEIFELADGEGYSRATVKRAKLKAHIDSTKEGYQGVWHWYRPELAILAGHKGAHETHHSTAV